MNKCKRIISILVMIFIIGFILYKSYNLYYYTYVYTPDKNETRIIKVNPIDIKTLRMIGNANCEQLHITIPQEFKYDEEKSKSDSKIKMNWYTKEPSENNTTSPSLVITKSEMNMDDFIKESGVRKANYNKELKEYRINNYFDLIEYYEKHQTEQQTLLTPISKIKMNHLAKVYVYFNIPSFETNYKLQGGVNGYMFKTKAGNYFVYLNHNNNIYKIDFNNTTESNYFNYEKVVEILNSIYFQ